MVQRTNGHYLHHRTNCYFLYDQTFWSGGVYHHHDDTSNDEYCFVYGVIWSSNLSGYATFIHTTSIHYHPFTGTIRYGPVSCILNFTLTSFIVFYPFSASPFNVGGVVGALLVFTAIFHSVYRQTRDKNKEKKPAVTAKVQDTPFHDTPFHDTPSHDTPSHNTHFHNTPSCHDTHVVILA